MAACSSNSDHEFECGLLNLPTETLLDIASYLTAYNRLCLRITCRRFHSILSDPRAWPTLVWRDCRRRESDFKALRLALRLSRSAVTSIAIVYPSDQRLPFSKFIPQVHSCKHVRHLSLSGKLVDISLVDKLVSQLPSLNFLSITARRHNQPRFSDLVPIAKHLEILQVVTLESLYFLLVSSWKSCNYSPPNLQVCDLNSSSYGYLYQSLQCLSTSDHPAKFSLYPKCSQAAGNLINQYPFLEITLYPNVQVASCSICPSSPESPLILCNGRTCDSSEESCKYISATYIKPSTPSSLPGNALPSLPSTIQSLCLAGLTHLTSADLSSISECCPNLLCLNVCGCSKALLPLEGLADISVKCLRLTSLDIKHISEVESVASLWEILASIKKLRHLAASSCFCSPERVQKPESAKKVRVSHIRPFDERSLSRVRNSVRKMGLTALELCACHHDIHVNPLQLEIFLPALLWLKHLRFVGFAPDLSNVLPHLPHLTHLAVACNLGSPLALPLPTDPHCFSSLEQIYLAFQRTQEISEELIQAWTHSRSLIRLYLFNVMFSPSLQFEAFPRLCEFLAHIRGRDLRSSRLKLDAFGIHGYVETKKYGHSFMLPIVESDVRSLWPEMV